MKIALTGGTGFIGGALLERLLSLGHQVRLLSRRPQQVPLKPGVEAAYFDVYQPLAPEALEGVEAVVHLAGEPIATRWSSEHKSRILSSRTLGTAAIAHGAARAGAKVLLSASGVGYYGPHQDEVLDESHPPGNDFLSKVCVAWEQSTQPASNAGVRVVISRIGLVLHPSGGVLGKLLVPFKAGLGGPVGSGRQYMSWIHRDDLIGLMLFLLEHDELSGVFNATAPEPVNNKQFASALGRALHRPALLPMPSLALKLALGELASTLLTGQRVLPKRALAAGFQFSFMQLQPALEELLSRRH